MNPSAIHPEIQRGRLVTRHAGTLMGLVLLVFTSFVEAAAFSIVDGNWTAAATWSNVACGGAVGGGVPTAETVVICAGTSVTVNATAVASVVFINAGGALLGGTAAGSRLTISGTPALHRSGTGTFIPQTGTIAITGNAAVTVATATAAAASVMTFNNLELSPTMSASRTYTLGAGQVGQFIVNGDFVVLPLDNTALNARVLTINDGTLNAATVVGRLDLDIRAGAASDDVVVFNAGGIPWSVGRIDIGGTGTGAKTFVAGASTITLNGSTSPLLTRATNGNFSAGTSTVLVSSVASTTLNSGTFSSAHAFNLLTINIPGQTVTLSGTANDDVTVNTELQLVAGTLDTGGRVLAGDGTGTLSAAAATTLTLSGTSSFPTNFSAYSFQPTSTVRYEQTNAATVATSVTVAAALTYGNLVVAPTVDSPTTHSFAAGTATVAGNLTIGNAVNTGPVSLATSNTTLDVDGAVSISAASTLIAPATNPFLVAGNWVNAGAFSAGTTSTVTLDGAAAQSVIGNTSFANLTATNGSASGITLGANTTVTVGNVLTLGAGPFIVGANSLVLNGPTIAGTPTNLSAGATSNLTFGGNTAGVNLPSNISSLNQLSVGNSVAAQSALTLNNSLTVGNLLTLNTGVINAGLNLLTVSANCPGSVVRDGASSVGWVEGEVRLTFPAGAATCAFPIGDAAGAGAAYAGMQLAFGAGTTAGVLTAAMTKEVHRNTTAGTSGILPALGVSRYWTLKNSTVAGTYTGTFTYVAGDSTGTPGNYRVRRGSNCAGTGVARNCTPWGSLTISGTPTTTTTSASGITITADSPAQADFSIGEADPTTNMQREKQFIYTRELY